jgi:hypothetical protein
MNTGPDTPHCKRVVLLWGIQCIRPWMDMEDGDL